MQRGAAFKRNANNVAGPFPTYFLVTMDYFSKWPKTYAIQNQEAMPKLWSIIRYPCRSAVPLKLYSNEGVSRALLLAEYYKDEYDPLNPQSDGMIERLVTRTPHRGHVARLAFRDLVPPPQSTSANRMRSRGSKDMRFSTLVTPKRWPSGALLHCVHMSFGRVGIDSRAGCSLIGFF